MSDIETLTIALPRDLVDDLRRIVGAGAFASADEAVEAALRDWRDHRDVFDYSSEELRALVDEGIASGPSKYAWIADVKAEARRRWQAKSG